MIYTFNFIFLAQPLSGSVFPLLVVLLRSMFWAQFFIAHIYDYDVVKRY